MEDRRGDICGGLEVSGLGLRERSSWGSIIGPGGRPPARTYWERSAWKVGTVKEDFAPHGPKPRAGLNIGGKGRPGQNGSPPTGGSPS